MNLPASPKVLAIFLSSSWLTVGLAQEHVPAAGPGNPSGSEQLSDSDWAGIGAAYEASRHRAFATDGGFAARNFGQGFLVDFDERGFTVAPDGRTWTWGLELVSYGFAGEERCVPERASAAADGQRVAYEWDADLTEWYVNGPSGLEHGFTLHERPSASAGELVFTLALRGELRASISPCGRDVHFATESGGAALTYTGLAVFDADGDALAARFDTTPEGLQLFIDERSASYPLTVDPIVQLAFIKASSPNVFDLFGARVAASGRTLVVGAWQEDSSATGINGNHADNGAPEAGAAYIYELDSTGAIQETYLKASNTGLGDYFGTGVAVSGDTVAIGAYGDDSAATGVNGNDADESADHSGAVFIFVRNGSTWSQQAYIKASNTDSFDAFGSSLSLSGDTLVVGAFGERSSATGVDGDQTDNSLITAGAAYVFVRNGTTWSQQAYLKASNTGASDLFGVSVSVSGDTALVGAENEDSPATGVNGSQGDDLATFSSGAVYVFVRNGSTWSQQAYLKASNTGSNDRFGRSVAISGNTAIVGSSGEGSSATGVNGNQANEGALSSGAAYVFVRNGSTWSQQAYLKASNTGSGDAFGEYVTLSGNTAVIGAPNEDSNAMGVNGDQGNDSTVDAGAAFVFTRSGSTWSQQAYLKAHNPSQDDAFGTSVALSGDMVVVGAETQGPGLGSGAAYFFDLDQNPGTSSFGTGTPGCAGTQTLGVSHAPMIGSPHFAITCNNAPPSTLGICMLSSQRNIPGFDYFGVGVLAHVVPTAPLVLQFGIQSDAFGNATSLNTSIPFDEGLIGLTLYAQAFWNWTGFCSLPPNDLSSSRGLAITVQVP